MVGIATGYVTQMSGAPVPQGRGASNTLVPARAKLTGAGLDSYMKSSVRPGAAGDGGWIEHRHDT